ncbi:Dph6-related ATP pyrophosphatase [Oceanobacillus manasiensis]|uniref:Dph6-related ATP pyrophosphatase n=1 Tax=Oceanobacillus manasiensis TaxID=586413 RepID=UPI0006946E5E|nr:hypothetical protein [Oceanobacillus manasiensis]
MLDIIVSWSGGKDSAYALHELRRSAEYRVVGLLSTISEASGRLPIHEITEDLLDAQASSLNLPMYKIEMPESVSNKEYEKIMGEQFKAFKLEGIHQIAYADLLLEDIKAYREILLNKHQMVGYYPLWKMSTAHVAEQFIDDGFKAIVTTIDSSVLPSELVGHEFNYEFIHKLPAKVDPCGENGEFHTFVYDGPIFQYPLSIKKGEQFLTHDGKFAHTDIFLG